MAPKAGSPEVLNALRDNMTFQGLAALIVPSEDAHQSEYVPLKDRRREYVTGFTGSAGTAVITKDKALLWTDGRYFLQAEQELGPDWTLMKSLEKDVPTLEKWLADNLNKGAVVGVDGLLVSVGQSRTWKKELDPKGVMLKALEGPDPVDVVWGCDQPALPDAPVRVHPLEYSGKTVLEKLHDIRAKVKEKGADVLIVTALDQIAWLFNIRGGDVEFNPVIIAYAVLTEDTAVLFVDKNKLTDEVLQHLGSDVQVRLYEDIVDYLDNTLLKPSAPPPASSGAEGKEKEQKSALKVLLDPNLVSLAIANKLPQESIVESPSPITLAKAIKNGKELAGMREAHVRDGAALTAFLAWLEKALEAGPQGDPQTRDGMSWPLTEASIADRLERFRAEQPKFVSLSFATIAGMGPNGAIIHYKPHEKGSAEITQDAMLLLDSGAQFLDGTTDVTRTVHYGTPTEEEKRSFTLVLKGHIALAVARFPENTLGAKLDILARLPLWYTGLDYKHGTGHGVGAFLNVHEGPQSISYKKYPYEEGLCPGMVTSNEPGYYADGKYGIRIESLVVCNEAKTQHNFGNVKYCEFETITMAPIQTSLIDRSLLTQHEVDWINTYHEQVRTTLQPLLAKDARATAYLMRETEPIALGA